jgi:multidrug efflux pump subunit AcrB
MIPGNNIVQYGEEVQKVMDEFIEASLPADVTVDRITDQCKVVQDSVNDFLINLVESMVIIFLVMLLLFPWRTAVVAGTMVPLNTFISVAIMYFCGIPLNTVTLAALIVVMGMVVDNAIVVLDGYLEFLGKGMSRWHAAAQSSMHYFMPMALATLCICAIFFPLLFVMTGMVKDMIFWLPWTIAINLLVSLLLAVVYIPIMEVALIKPKKKSQQKKNKKTITDYVQNGYDHILAWTFRHPWLTIFGGILIVVCSVVTIGPLLKIRMMPTADRNQFAVEITLPENKGLAETRIVADSVYKVLRRDKRVLSVTSFIGCASPRFHGAYAPKSASRNYAQFIVNTSSSQDTEDVLDKYEPMSDIFPDAFVKFKQLDYQNFTPFEFRFYGENIDSLHRVADDVMALMRQNPDVMNVKTDYGISRPYVDITLDPVATAQMGTNRMMVELELMLNTGEVQVGQVWEDDYQVPVILKDPQYTDMEYSTVADLYMSAGTSSVPLRQIADVSPEWGENNILHRNGVRCITVNVEAKRGVYTNALQSGFAQMIRDKIQLPKGMRFELGGEPENDAETQATIFDGLAVSFIIVFFFLLFNFKTYKITTVSILSIFLFLPGALIGLWIMNRPIGVTTVCGIITLMGMIMRNEILIFEHADDLRKKGWTARDAAYDAGRRRMVPIFLTTATTAMGVVPMIIAATSFWMPVGVTICAGGIGSLIMVVVMLPVIYWKLYNKKKDKA